MPFFNNSSKLLFLLALLIVGIPGITGLKYYVDNSVVSSGDGGISTPFKSVSEALAQVLTGNTNLKDNAIIVLSPTSKPYMLAVNSAGTPLNIIGKSNPTTSLSIISMAADQNETFELPQLQSPDHCSELPILHVVNTTFQTLSNLLFHGVFLQFADLSTPISLNVSTTNTVSLAAACLGLQSSLPYKFKFNIADSVSSVMLHQVLLAANTGDFSLSSSVPTTNITNLTIWFDSMTSETVLGPWFSVSGQNAVNAFLTNVAFASNQTISSPGIANVTLMTIRIQSNLAINNLIFSHLHIEDSGSVLFSLQASDIVINETSFVNFYYIDQSFTPFDLFEIQAQNQLIMENIQINSSNLTSRLLIEAYDVQKSGNVTVQGLLISNSVFSNISIIEPDANTTLLSQITILDSSLTDAPILNAKTGTLHTWRDFYINNTVVQGSLMQTNFVGSSYNISFQNFTMLNSELISGTFFNLKFTYENAPLVRSEYNALLLNDFLVDNTSFYNTTQAVESNFLGYHDSYLKVMNFTLTNSYLRLCYLFESFTRSTASLISGMRVENSQLDYTYIQAYFPDTNAIYGTTSETQENQQRMRGFINSNFSRVNFSSSAVVTTRSPVVIFSNNSFTDCNFSQTIMLQLREGNKDSVYNKSLTMEESIFPELFTMTTEIMDEILEVSQYWQRPENTLFQLFSGNVIRNSDFLNSKILSSLRAAFVNSILLIRENELDTIRFYSDPTYAPFDNVQGDDIEFANNTLRAISGKVYLINVDSANAEAFLNFTKNNFSELNGPGFARIRTDTLSHFEISKNNIYDSEMRMNFIYLLLDSYLINLNIWSNSFINSKLKCGTDMEYALRINLFDLMIPVALPESNAQIDSLIVSKFEFYKDQMYVTQIHANSLFRLLVGQMPLNLTNSTFEFVHVHDDGNLLEIASNDLRFENCRFSNITVEDRVTGAFLILTPNFVLRRSVFDTIVVEDESQGGILSIFEDRNLALPVTILMHDNMIVSCHSTSGSFLALSSLTVNFSGLNNTFIDNSLDLFNGASILLTDVIMQSFVFNNFTIIFNEMLNQYYSNFLFCARCSGLMNIGNGTLLVKNNSNGFFINVTSSFAFAANITDITVIGEDPLPADTSLNLFDWLYTNVGLLYEIREENALPNFTFYATDSGELSMRNGYFKDLQIANLNIFQLQCGLIPEVNLTNISFENIVVYKPASEDTILVNEAGVISLLPSGSDPSGGLPVNITLNNMTFNRIIFSGSGSALKNTNQGVSNINITNSTFSNIRTYLGPAITLNPDLYPPYPVLIVTNSTFVNNSADLSDGGAIANDNADMILQGNKFISNTANRMGAAIFSTWNLNATELNKSNNLFENNTIIDGKDLDEISGAAPQFMSSPVSVIAIPQVDASEYLKVLNWDPLNLSIGNLSLTNKFSLAFMLKDANNYTVPDTDGYKYIKITYNHDVTVSRLNCTRYYCWVGDLNTILRGPVNTNINVMFSYNSTSHSLSNSMTFVLRECIPGEINDTDAGGCYRCPPGKYALSPKQSSCIECPEGSRCNGGNNIETLTNYWRGTDIVNTSGIYVNIIPCEDQDLCNQENCTEGYTGPGCQQCDLNEGYISSNGECRKCGEGWRAFIVFFMIMGFQFVVNYSFLANMMEMSDGILKDKSGKPPQIASYMRVFLSFAQVTSIIIRNTKWLPHVLALIQAIGFPTFTAMNYFRCLFHYSSTNYETIYRLSIGFIVCSPWIQFIIYMMFFFKKWVWNSIGYRRWRFLGMLGGIFLIEFPEIAYALVGFTHCVKFDNYSKDYYMPEDPNVRCYTPEFDSFFQAFVFPSAIIWFGVIPLILLLSLIFTRKKFDDPRVRLSLGPFINEYRESRFFWQITGLLFKVLLMMLHRLIDDDLKTLVLVTILTLYLFKFVLGRTKPYRNRKITSADKVTLYVNMATAAFLFYYQGSKDHIKMICTVVVYSANIMIFVYFGLKSRERPILWKVSNEMILKLTASRHRDSIQLMK